MALPILICLVTYPLKWYVMRTILLPYPLLFWYQRKWYHLVERSIWGYGNKCLPSSNKGPIILGNKLQKISDRAITLIERLTAQSMRSYSFLKLCKRPYRRVKEERGNVPLIGVSSFKALTCRVSSSQVLTIWPLPLFRLGNSIWLDDFGYPSSGNSMMS